MNIFWFSTALRHCAQLHPRKLLAKMQLEHTQLLAQALQYYDKTAVLTKLDGTGYKATHISHPCAIWARANRQNFNLLVDLTIELAQQYERVFGKQSSFLPVLAQARNMSFVVPIAEPGYRQTYAIAINDFWLQCMASEGTISQSELELIQQNKLGLADSALVTKVYTRYLCLAKCHYADWADDQIPDFWPRQDGNGRLWCKLPSIRQAKQALQSADQTISEADKSRADLFYSLYELIVQKSAETGMPKIAKNKFLKACIDCNWCEADLMQIIEARFAPRPEKPARQARSVKSAEPAELRIPELSELVNCADLSELRSLIYACTGGAKVPSIKTLEKWQATEPNLAERALGHIQFWCEPTNRQKWL